MVSRGPVAAMQPSWPSGNRQRRPRWAAAEDRIGFVRQLRGCDAPFRDRRPVRVAGLRVAGEVVQRLALVGDLHLAVIAGDQRELAGDTTVGLDLVEGFDDERGPVVEAR